MNKILNIIFLCFIVFGISGCYKESIIDNQEEIITSASMDSRFKGDAYIYDIGIKESDGDVINDRCLFRKANEPIIENIIVCEKSDYSNGDEIPILYRWGQSDTDWKALGERTFHICSLIFGNSEECLSISEKNICVNPYVNPVNVVSICQINIYDENIKLGTEFNDSLPYDWNHYYTFYIENFSINKLDSQIQLFTIFLSKYEKSDKFVFKEYIWYRDRMFTGDLFQKAYSTGYDRGGRFYYLDEENISFPTDYYIYEVPDN